MKQHAGILWILTIIVLALSLAGLGFWYWLQLPAMIGIASGLCALLSVVAIMLLEEWQPLQ